MRIQYSIHNPSEFIRLHTHQLLPTWSLPISSVLIVLQQCQIDLLQLDRGTEVQKNQLRDRFLQFGSQTAWKLQEKGHLAEVFDPKTGLPLLSPAGRLALDDVAVVRHCLGYESICQGNCQVVLHPTWASAVYPSTIVSSAFPQELTAVVEAIVLCSSDFAFLEYHHSC